MPELDGLRAFAVLGVLLYHMSIRGFSLGWSGVMLFFVISGFLITGILLDARGKPNYFRNFYFRRALRILPIYYLSLAAVVAFGLWQGQSLADLPYYLVYGQNVIMGLTGFQTRFPIMFNHTWSLAVEQQFYLLWPAAVLLAGRRRLFLVLVLGLFAVAFLSRTYLLAEHANPYLVYTSLPTELEPLAAGAALAVVARSGLEPSFIAGRALSICLASGLGLLYLIYENGLPAFWHLDYWSTRPADLPLTTLLALFFGSILAMAVFGRGLLSAILRISFLGYLGRISYGIYMYHFPVFVMVDNFLWRFLPTPPGTGWLEGFWPTLAKLALTYLLAVASWWLVESPLLRLKDRRR